MEKQMQSLLEVEGSLKEVRYIKVLIPKIFIINTKFD